MRRIGAIVWILAIQFFIAQVVVQLGWTSPFSLTQNFISDLGNTACAPYGGRFVCSPWHSWMNLSFVLLGLSILGGAILMRGGFGTGPLAGIGLTLVGLAGPGVIAVGLFPENVSIVAHRIGAGTNFVLGNSGIALLGVAMLANRRWTTLGLFSVVVGSIGLVATALLVSDQYLGLGVGTIERLAAYTIPGWLVVAGVWLFRRPHPLSPSP